MIALLALLSCKGPAPEPEPGIAVCESDDAAWVQRVLPLMWGRRAHGAAEVRAWASMADAAGRPAVIQALAADPEYARWWRQWITDALAVARTGDKAYASCFGEVRRDLHDGSLTAHLRDTEAPWEPTDVPSFTMADVILDGLAADDLSGIWRVNLYARMNRPVQGANVSFEELEYNRRVNFGEVFFETYLNRNLDCVLCHNSAFSVTDAADAREDLTWQLPGHHEAALLGSDVSFEKDEAFAMFRHWGVARDDGGRTPFGMSTACGEFYPPDRVEGPDILGQETTWLVEPYGPEGSVWQLERNLALGVDALDGGALEIGPDGAVDARESFAYLLAARIADRVFEVATGGRLTIAHGFPRNLDQAARLEAYADRLVASRFSLQDLLVAITADPVFTSGLPDPCGAPAYGLPPVANPWSVEADAPAERPNSAGDVAHRAPARVLLNSAHHQLGWAPSPVWELPEEEADFQAALGVFLRESQPGFNGTDFQGLLAWTERYGTCASPTGEPDWLDALVQAAGDRPVEDVVLALEDRLIAHGALSADERPLVEALVGPLTTPASAVDPAGLRALCGVMLASPAWMLVLESEVGPVPALGSDPLAECERAAELVRAIGGTPATCPSDPL